VSEEEEKKEEGDESLHSEAKDRDQMEIEDT
jgi:hypothetical protein